LWTIWTPNSILYSNNHIMNSLKQYLTD